MVNLYIKVNKQLLDFSSENIDKKTEEIQEYNLVVSDCSEFMNNLYKQIIHIKGDWINMSYHETLGTCYATIDLIFHGTELDLHSSNLLNDIIKEIEKCVLENKNEQININNSSNIKFNQDGFFVLFTENGGSALVNHMEIENKFAEKGIEFERVSLSSNQYDGGCGSGSESIVYFIFGAIASGITWDIIKSVSNYLYRETKEEVILKTIEDNNFKHLRKKVADKINVEESLLVVQEIHKMEAYIKIVFKTKDKIINLRTDMKSNILEMNVDKILD